MVSAMVLGDLFEPARAARLVAFADRQQNAIGLPEVMAAVLGATWDATRPTSPMHRSLRRVTERAALDALMILGGHAEVTPEVRAVVLQAVAGLGRGMAARNDGDAVTEAHCARRSETSPGISRIRLAMRRRRCAGLGPAAPVALSAQSGSAAGWRRQLRAVALA